MNIEFFSVFMFFIGLFFGSFFGVITDRLKEKKSFIFGRSKCEFCKKELAFLDLIPVLSFIFLKGKCRYCHKRLSVTYPLIEVSTGLIFALSYIYSPLVLVNGSLNFSFFYNLFIFSLLLILFFQDLKYGFLSDKIIILTSVVVLLFYVFFQKELFLNHLLSAILSFLFFILISYVFFLITKKQGMGGGDIKLSFLLGLFLGFPGIILCLYIAFLTGAFASIILILWRKKDFLKDSVPFGPFLIIGAYLSFFLGGLIYPQVFFFLGI